MLVSGRVYTWIVGSLNRSSSWTFFANPVDFCWGGGTTKAGIAGIKISEAWSIAVILGSDFLGILNLLHGAMRPIMGLWVKGGEFVSGFQCCERIHQEIGVQSCES